MIDPEKKEIIDIATNSLRVEWDADEESTELSILQEVSNIISNNDEAATRRTFNMQIPLDFSYSYLLNNQKSIFRMLIKRSGKVKINYKEFAFIYIDPMRNPIIYDMVSELSEEEIKLYAEIYWNQTRYNLSDADDVSLNFEAKTFSSYSNEILYVDKDTLEEIYGDVMSDYLEEGFKNDYNKFKKTFLYDIQDEFNQRSNELIAILETINPDRLVDTAIEYYKTKEDDMDEFLNDLLLRNEIESEKSPEVILTIPKEIIINWGITKGTFYENAPWNLVRLDIGHLKYEGKVMRHCVGYQGYAFRLFKKEIEIWSLRNKDGNPRFTFEVFSVWNNSENPQQRAKYFEQIKGKTNRLAGYESPRSREIKFPDEIIFLTRLLSDMGVDPSHVTDLFQQIIELGIN